MKKIIKALIVMTIATMVAVLAVGCTQEASGKTYAFSEVTLINYAGDGESMLNMWTTYYTDKTIEFKEDGTLLIGGIFEGYYLQKGGDIFVSQSKDNFDTISDPSIKAKGDSVTLTFKDDNGTINVIFKLK